MLQYNTMNNTYSIHELVEATGFSRRSIRYFVSLQLIDPPHGNTKSAIYLQHHYDKLLRIKTLTDKGYRLDRVRQILNSSEEQPQDTPEVPVGSVETLTRIHLSDGIELVVNKSKARLSAAHIQQLTSDIYKSLNSIHQHSTQDNGENS